MSIFSCLFKKLEEQKAVEEAQRAATLADVYDCITRGVVSPPKTEKDIAADQALLESAIVGGLISEEQVKQLIDKATVLVNYLRDGETECPPIDFDECQATIAQANQMIAAARRKVTDAQSISAMVNAARGNAQALIAELPEIGEQIARAMKASWNPRVCPVTNRKLNDEQPTASDNDSKANTANDVAPQNHADQKREPNDLGPTASVVASVSDV